MVFIKICAYAHVNSTSKDREVNEKQKQKPHTNLAILVVWFWNKCCLVDRQAKKRLWKNWMRKRTVTQQYAPLKRNSQPCWKASSRVFGQCTTESLKSHGESRKAANCEEVLGQSLSAWNRAEGLVLYAAQKLCFIWEIFRVQHQPEVTIRLDNLLTVTLDANLFIKNNVQAIYLFKT